MWQLHDCEVLIDVEERKSLIKLELNNYIQIVCSSSSGAEYEGDHPDWVLPA